MALRIHQDKRIINKENIKTKIVTKNVPISHFKRSALNDLGNTKLVTKHLNDVPNNIKNNCNNGIKKTVKRVGSFHKQEESIGFSNKQSEIIDPDVNLKNDPQLVSEYIKDIMKYLKELEDLYPIREKYLTANHQTTPKMRAILIDWMVSVHLNFRLVPETLYLSTSIVDQFLQDLPQIGKESLQLVGVAALFIASKYEEIIVQDISDFVYVCDDAFSKRDILRMEIKILTKLEYNLGKPSSIHFLRRYSKIAEVKSEQHNLSKYILELVLIEYTLAHYKPSLQAAAACCLSLAIFNNTYNPAVNWTPSLAFYSDYKYTDIKNLVIIFARLLFGADKSPYQKIRQKYASSQYGKISVHPNLSGKLLKHLSGINIK